MFRNALTYVRYNVHIENTEEGRIYEVQNQRKKDRRKTGL